MNQMLIVAGEYSLSTFEGTEQIFRPARMVVHPDYSASSKNADIMLIKVTPTSWAGGLATDWEGGQRGSQCFSGEFLEGGSGRFR